MPVPSGDVPDLAVGGDPSAPVSVPRSDAEPGPLAPAAAEPKAPAASANAEPAPPVALADAEPTPPVGPANAEPAPPAASATAGPTPPVSLTEVDSGAPTPPTGYQFVPFAWAPLSAIPAAAGTPDAPDTPAMAAPAGHRRQWAATLAVAVAAAIVLVAAFGAAGRAHAELTRKPTSAELSAAAALGVASRWQRWPAGQIFPAQLSYTTDLLNQETAQRDGIAPGDGCTAALDTAQAALARRFGCRAALRATYVDQLGGIVYTLGVLAFPSARASAGFYSRYTASQTPVRGLHALALPGTSARSEER